jgi:hypothetical protein
MLDVTRVEGAPRPSKGGGGEGHDRFDSPWLGGGWRPDAARQHTKGGCSAQRREEREGRRGRPGGPVQGKRADGQCAGERKRKRKSISELISWFRKNG